MDDLTPAPLGADDGLGFELLAASLRADTVDTRAFLEALATKMEGALPTFTSVERARDGMFKSTTHVERISIDLGGFRYSIAAGKRGAMEATRAKIVGGVVIKTDTLGLDAWTDALARGLTAHAESSATARAALERLIT
jgi:hypothetical protein